MNHMPDIVLITLRAESIPSNARWIENENEVAREK